MSTPTPRSAEDLAISAQFSTQFATQFAAKPEEIFVTGATGFIGRLLVPALLADGHRVTVLSRDPDQASALFGAEVRCIAHMRELPASQQIDVMINLAGARILGWRWTVARKRALRKSRVDLTLGLVEWIATAAHKPRLLLSASAIGYYGLQAEGDATRLSETSPPQAIFMSELCQEWEAAAARARSDGVTVSCLRFGLVLGQGGALPMMLLPIKLGLGGRLGSGKQWTSWIHVQDLIRAIGHLCRLAEPVAPAYNFTAPEIVSQLQFSQTAADLLRRPCFLPTPAFPLRWALGEQADLLLGGQAVTPVALTASGFQFRFPTLAGALKNLL